MENIKIVFSQEEKDFIKGLNEENFGEFSQDQIISSQNKVFSALTGKNIDYSKASPEEAVELFRSALLFDSGDEFDHEINAENCKDNLEKLAYKFINNEKCLGDPDITAVKNGNAVRFDFSDIQMDFERKEIPKKPNWFKRLINSIFGGFQKDFDQYYADEKAYDDYFKQLNRVTDFRASEDKFYNAFEKELENQKTKNGLNLDEMKQSFDTVKKPLEIPVEDIFIDSDIKDDFEEDIKSAQNKKIMKEAAGLKNDQLEKLLSELDFPQEEDIKKTEEVTNDELEKLLGDPEDEKDSLTDEYLSEEIDFNQLSYRDDTNEKALNLRHDSAPVKNFNGIEK